MKLSREYDRTRFPAEVIKEAAVTLFSGIKETPNGALTVIVDGGEWSHDSEEEFFADYRRSSGAAYYWMRIKDRSIVVHSFIGASVTVTVEAPSRSEIQRVFEVFDRNAESAKLPEPPKEVEPPPVVFIGHGRSSAWRDLKDHLQDKHGLEIAAYEIGARAGHAIRDILQDMLRRSSFAILVMTADDETHEGEFRVRQNVVHEAGLFQGRLGFNRAIVLIENGAEQFSNLQGIDQIRFARGNIKETFGEVLATVRREFGGG